MHGRLLPPDDEDPADLRLQPVDLLLDRAPAVAVLPGDPVAVEHALKRSVERAIGGIARLERVYVLPSMPKTRAGKIMRRLLREAAETGEVRGDTSGLEDVGAVTTLLTAVRRSVEM